MTNHNQKILQVKNKMELKGYSCKRNFPVFTDRWRYIDLVCEKSGKKSFAFEIETKNQQAENGKKLEIFRRNQNGRTCQLGSNDNLDRCFKRW